MTGRTAIRVGIASLRADLVGAAYLLSAAGFTVIVTWQLAPLIMPALGCVALAIVAIPERRPAQSTVQALR
jgi:hypothetical protein